MIFKKEAAPVLIVDFLMIKEIVTQSIKTGMPINVKI
jgi:hypothetical protein